MISDCIDLIREIRLDSISYNKKVNRIIFIIATDVS
ncbi:MAG: hypothetical protein DDT41_00417 [candidate division WS2 bacterium]|nr:hypothetical protein [Candidatus Psychracetigena formicireducens]